MVQATGAAACAHHAQASMCVARSSSFRSRVPEHRVTTVMDLVGAEALGLVAFDGGTTLQHLPHSEKLHCEGL